MKALLVLTLFTFFLVYGCIDDDQPLLQGGIVKVSIDGQSYYESEGNILNVFERKTNVDRQVFYSVVLFASGKNNEDEDFTFTGRVSSLNETSELLEDVNVVTFLQIGNDCSGSLLIRRENATVNLAEPNGTASGSISGTFLSVLGGCETDFNIELEEIRIR